MHQDDLDSLLPGACIIRGDWGAHGSVYFTLGLTQPVGPEAASLAWELVLYTREPGPWAAELLAELMADCERLRRSGDEVGAGDYWPAIFHRDRAGDLHASVAAPDARVRPASAITGLYIWPDHHRAKQVESPTGPFHFMAVTGVTDAEDQLAQRTSPPHLLAAMQLYGNAQELDPARAAVASDPRFLGIWARVRQMDYEGLMHEMRKHREQTSAGNRMDQC